VPMKGLLRESQRREAEMVRLLARFVRCESPSRNKTAVERFGKIVAGEFRKRGAKIRCLRQRSRGDHLRAEIWMGKGRPGAQVLVLGHLDTVYPLGTLRRVPFRIAAGRAWGPGSFDMKGGIVIALAAVDALRAARIAPGKRLVFLWTSDEEIGSETSRRIIEQEARKSDAVLVLEPSLGPEGRVKTARKGVGSAEIIVTGRSAHAGVDPEKGVNAVEGLALQIARLRKLHQPHRGITVQATVIEGGTTSNVIPACARAELDIRFQRLADERALRKQLLSIRPILHGARVEIRLGSFRPPLERTTAVRTLFHQAQSLASEIGVHLGEASTGGGSDGNFTAALGIPTLDGLGAIGDAPHSPREHIVIGKLPQRAALLAALFATL
jgi:glutamate carboxypeptidase